MSYQLRIIRRLLEVGESKKHTVNANVATDGHIVLYVHDSRAGRAVVDSFYTDEHEDERDVFIWLNAWADIIREEQHNDIN